MSVRILIGDVREQLKTLADDSVDCVVTSPPYWGLRDYGFEGQLGLERTLGEHVEVMAEVFLDVRRVLKPTGTLWLNYGDSYATSVNGRSAADTKAVGNDDRTFRDKPFSTIGPIYSAEAEDGDRRGASGNRGAGDGSRGRILAGGMLKPKDLCGIPWRVAFALQESGWWLRQDIIWSKPNPMPESVTDRCTKAHEYLFLLAKSERYYYDADAIAEAAAYVGITGQDASGFKDPKNYNGKHGKNRATFRGGSYCNNEAFDNDAEMSSAGVGSAPNPSGLRNKRSVWEVATAPFSEAHFATFPPALIEPCILAGCPKGGTVLDPFFGAGTTGLVADRLGRDCIGIDRNPEYAEIARKRIIGDCPMFSSVA